MKERLDRKYFENLYGQSPEPWGFETSAYEHNKYERTLEVLRDRQGSYRNALEVGCSIGVFTAMLAPLCDKLWAVDISEKAIATARERLATFPHVRVERRRLPEETPKGPFDLIIASEVLYYWPERVMLAAQGDEDLSSAGRRGTRATPQEYSSRQHHHNSRTRVPPGSL